MFYCDECKTTRKQSTCPVDGKHNVWKYWWTFGPDDNHKNSYKIYYKPDGTIDRETPLGE